MKIHIHTPSFFPQLVGMTYAADAHARILTKLGARVVVIPAGLPPAVGSEQKCYEVRYFGLSGSGLPWSPSKGDFQGLHEFTRNEKPDIIIAEGWYTPGSQQLTKLAEHARHIVISSHGAVDLSRSSNTPPQWGRWLAYVVAERLNRRQVLRKLSGAIVLSTYEDNERFADIAAYREHNIPLFVCPNFSVYSIAAQPRLKPHGKRLLHVGEMLPHKNQKLGIEILTNLPKDFSLTFVFPKETYYSSEVRKLVDEKKLGDRVNYVVGQQRWQIEPVFEQSDLILILSASKEAQPIVAADAMAKAIPFVSTKVGCMPDFKGGIISEPSHFAHNVLHIFETDAIYAQYSEASYQYYHDALSREQAVRSMQKMLAHLK